MSTALIPPPGMAQPSQPVDPRLLHLKQMVLDSVVSANSKRNYAQALDGLFRFRGRPAAHPGAPDGVARDHGRAGTFNGERPTLSGPQDGF